MAVISEKLGAVLAQMFRPDGVHEVDPELLKDLTPDERQELNIRASKETDGLRGAKTSPHFITTKPKP